MYILALHVRIFKNLLKKLIKPETVGGKQGAMIISTDKEGGS